MYPDQSTPQDYAEFLLNFILVRTKAGRPRQHGNTEEAHQRSRQARGLGDLPNDDIDPDVAL